MEEIRQALLQNGIEKVTISYDAGGDQCDAHLVAEEDVLAKVQSSLPPYKPVDQYDKYDWRLHDYAMQVAERFTDMRDYEFSAGAGGNFIYDVKQDKMVENSHHGYRTEEVDF